MIQGLIEALYPAAVNQVETSLPDIPRFITGVAEWAACLIYIILSRKRVRMSLLVVLIVFAFAVQCAFHHFAGLLPIALWIPGMIMAVVLMFLFIFACCRISPVSALRLCFSAFIVAEFAASLEWQLFYYFFKDGALAASFLTKAVFMAAVYVVVFPALFVLEARYIKHITAETGLKEVLSVAGIALAAFTVSNLSFISSNTPFSGRYAMEVFYIRTLVDFCGIVLLFSYREQRLWAYAKVELAAMQNLLLRQYQQYRQSKESIEIINRKHHDLKHQIAVIRAEANPEKRTRYLEEMEQSIRVYEAQNKTGNDILDTVRAADCWVLWMLWISVRHSATPWTTLSKAQKKWLTLTSG